MIRYTFDLLKKQYKFTSNLKNTLATKTLENQARCLCASQRFFFAFRAKDAFKKKTAPLDIETNYQVGDLTRCVYRRMKIYNEQYLSIQKQLSQEQQSSGDVENKNEDLRKKINSIQQLNDIFEKLRTSILNLQELKKQLDDPSNNEAEMIELIKEEIEGEVSYLDDLQDECLEMLLPKGKHSDCREITLEVRPGTGGSESSLFSEEMINMYQAYLSGHGYQSAIDQFLPDISINKGCRLGVIKASGDSIYTRMMNESGVHKVIRVPETESKGRLHSSTISVVVMPVVPMDFKVDEKELKYEFMRSQGAGGQHVNKVESACRVTHIPTGVNVVCQDDRQQERNKIRALKLLTEKLFQLEIEKTNEENSNARKSQIGGGDRSDKIRTYNFPQSRVTDHRTNLTVFGIERMMKGEFLEEFIDSFQEKSDNEKLEQLLLQLEEENTNTPQSK